MALYETTFIARQDISSQEVEKLTEEFENLITENGGEVLKKEYWGLRSLAYKVSKNKKGHYIFLVIKASADALKKLQRKYKLSEDVIRNLSVKIDEVPKEPSPVMSSNKKPATRRN